MLFTVEACVCSLVTCGAYVPLYGVYDVSYEKNHYSQLIIWPAFGREMYRRCQAASVSGACLQRLTLSTRRLLLCYGACIRTSNCSTYQGCSLIADLRPQLDLEHHLEHLAIWRLSGQVNLTPLHI